MGLEAISCLLGLVGHGPVLLEILLDVIENSEFFVESDQEVLVVV